MDQNGAHVLVFSAECYVNMWQKRPFCTLFCIPFCASHSSVMDKAAETFITEVHKIRRKDWDNLGARRLRALDGGHVQAEGLHEEC